MAELADRPIRLDWGRAVRVGVTAGFYVIILTALPIVGLTSWMRAYGLAALVMHLAPGVLVGGVATFGNLRMQRDRQRRARGWCVRCGYDLRETPGGGRCPECGGRKRGARNAEF